MTKEGIRDEKGRLTFQANPEVFMKMAHRMADSWCAKTFARQVEEKYPNIMKKLHESENKA